MPRTGDDVQVVIIGGGPGGYEAALTAARQGARTTLVEDRGVGGAAVLTDVVPSKTLIATAEVLDLAIDPLSPDQHRAMREIAQRIVGTIEETR